MDAEPARRTLAEIVSEPSYGSRVVEAIAKVACASTPRQVLDCLQCAKTAMGAEQAVFVSYLRGEDAHESYRFILAADPRWCFEYQASAWYGSDPWLLYASMNSEITCASRIEARTEQQRKVQALAEKYSMVSVCIAPASSAGTNARVGMLALGSSQQGFFECEAALMLFVLARSLSMELHQWFCRYERAEIIERLRITGDELQLLRLEFRGCGTKQAAGELGASRAAIDSRWQRLNRKLGAPHRQFAARLAAKYGLI